MVTAELLENNAIVSLNSCGSFAFVEHKILKMTLTNL